MAKEADVGSVGRRHIVIADWDNTLFPTAALRGLVHHRTRPRPWSTLHKDPRLQAFFTDMSPVLEHLFQWWLQRTQEVYLVTDSPRGWVLHMTQLYLPSLLPYFRVSNHHPPPTTDSTTDFKGRIQIIHTGDINRQTLHVHRNANLTPIERLVTSKCASFFEVCQRVPQHVAVAVKNTNHSTTLVTTLWSVGDSSIEHHAASMCLAKGFVDQVHLLKMHLGMNLYHWRDQLLYLESCFQDLWQ